MLNISRRKGKVRDIYEWDDQILLVATDRISAFDWVLPTLIPDKGRVLTQLSDFWFDLFNEPNHRIATLSQFEPPHAPFEGPDWEEVLSQIQRPAGESSHWLAGRTMLARRCEVAPVECVVRGYLVGSGWKDYHKTGSVCGVDLPKGLPLCSQLPEPIFTPATKAESGHDENISFGEMAARIGEANADELRRRSLALYHRGAQWAQSKGIIIADTKFEWGLCDGQWLLVDEVLTPDSSRFWPADQYEPGRNQVSFDKQFVRQWLEETDWDKNSPPPQLPPEIVAKTREKYVEAFERLTEKKFV